MRLIDGSADVINEAKTFTDHRIKLATKPPEPPTKQ
jgi:hypothetical protein